MFSPSRTTGVPGGGWLGGAGFSTNGPALADPGAPFNKFALRAFGAVATEDTMPGTGGVLAGKPGTCSAVSSVVSLSNPGDGVRSRSTAVFRCSGGKPIVRPRGGMRLGAPCPECGAATGGNPNSGGDIGGAQDIKGEGKPV